MNSYRQRKIKMRCKKLCLLEKSSISTKKPTKPQENPKLDSYYAIASLLLYLNQLTNFLSNFINSNKIIFDRFFSFYYKSLPIMIKQILLTLAALLCLTIQLQPNRKVLIPNNTKQLLYSSGQKYLIAASLSQVSVYSGVNGTHLIDLDLQDSTDVASVAISPSNKMVAVGFQSGIIKLYSVDKDLSPDTIEAPKASTVRSLCFTKDDEYLISGFEDDLFTIYNIEEDEIQEMDFSNQRVFSVACSPTEKGKFVVGGGQSTLAKFTLFKKTQNETLELVDFPDHSNMTVLASAFSQNGQNIYRAGVQGTIYMYHMTSQTDYDEPVVIDVGSTQTLYAMLVSVNQNVLATVDDQNAYVIFMDRDSLTMAIQTQPTTSRTVALAPKGLNLAVVGTNQEANILGQCLQKQYLDGNQQCQPCDDSCTLCQDTSTFCFGCENSFYLDDINNKCITCGAGCLSCQEPNNCVNCSTDGNFEPDGTGNCQCIDTYYLSVDTCQLCSQAIDNCISCTSATSCTTCSENRQPSADRRTCVCKPGFYELNNTCFQCQILHCLQCISENDCSVCDESKDWILNITDNKCICRDGFRQEQDRCIACPAGCITCDSNSTCLQCDETRNFDPVPNADGSCDCLKAYYFENDTSRCDPCILGCKDCTDGITCDECDEEAHFNITPAGKCACQSDSYIFYKNKCAECGQFMQYCLTCETQFICTKCAGELDFSDLKCQCRAGSYANEEYKCLECPEECSTCQNPDNCLSCKDGYNLDGDGHCQSSGLDPLIIVLIVIGSIFLIAAVFVIIKCIKKKKSNSMYEELD